MSRVIAFRCDRFGFPSRTRCHAQACKTILERAGTVRRGRHRPCGDGCHIEAGEQVLKLGLSRKWSCPTFRSWSIYVVSVRQGGVGCDERSFIIPERSDYSGRMRLSVRRLQTRYSRRGYGTRGPAPRDFREKKIPTVSLSYQTGMLD